MIKSTYFVLMALVALAALYILLKLLIRTYFAWRGKAVVTCPETGNKVAVEVDARHAAWTRALGSTDLQLQQCTRWPERQNCGQECLSQLESSPESCLLQAILTDWYQGQSCAFCNRKFSEINWHDHKPGLRTTARDLMEWSEVPVEIVHAFLKTSQPVCWNCMIAEEFRQKHPELVTDRPRRRGHLQTR